MGTIARQLNLNRDSVIRGLTQLEQRLQAQAESPPRAVCLPDHVKRRDVPVRPHRLGDYDTLMENADDQP